MKAAMIGLALLLSWGAGFVVQGWHKGAEIAELQAALDDCAEKNRKYAQSWARLSEESKRREAEAAKQLAQAKKSIARSRAISDEVAAFVPADQNACNATAEVIRRYHGLSRDRLHDDPPGVRAHPSDDQQMRRERASPRATDLRGAGRVGAPAGSGEGADHRS